MSTDQTNTIEQQLTAYAVGELAGPERDAIEAWLAANPAARRELEAIRATARLLKDELSNEPTTGLAADQRAAVEGRLAHVAHGRANGPTAAGAEPHSRYLLIRALGVAAALLIAAGIVWVILASLQTTREVAAGQHMTEGERPSTDGPTRSRPGYAGERRAHSTTTGPVSISATPSVPTTRPGMPGMMMPGMYPGMGVYSGMASGSYTPTPGMPGTPG